jgi:hypothetical protein
MLTTTESSDVGVAGVCPPRLTETGGAEVFITASLRLASSLQARIRNE